MNKVSHWFPVFLAVASWVVVGCGGSPKVRYDDPERVETVTADYGSTDLQKIANEMAEGFLSSKFFAGTGSAPVVMIGKVRNKTDEHIDTETLSSRLRVNLLNSGKVRFVARGDIPNELKAELDLQISSGFVDPTTAQRYGKAVGAQYYLTGQIDSIRKTAGRTSDVYFNVILELISVESWEYVWAKEVEIRKISRRPLMGW